MQAKIALMGGSGGGWLFLDRVSMDKPSKEVIFELRSEGMCVSGAHTNLGFGRVNIKNVFYNSGYTADSK